MTTGNLGPDGRMGAPGLPEGGAGRPGGRLTLALGSSQSRVVDMAVGSASVVDCRCVVGDSAREGPGGSLPGAAGSVEPYVRATAKNDCSPGRVPRTTSQEQSGGPAQRWRPVATVGLIGDPSS